MILCNFRAPAQDLGLREPLQELHTVHLDEVAVGNPLLSVGPSAQFLWSLVSSSFPLASFPCLSKAFPSFSSPRHVHPMHISPKGLVGAPANSAVAYPASE